MGGGTAGAGVAGQSLPFGTALPHQASRHVGHSAVAMVGVSLIRVAGLLQVALAGEGLSH